MTTTSEPLVLPSGIEPPRFYSPLAETTAGRGSDLPHWEQRHCTAFVTFRLADSLPQGKLEQWRSDESEWLESHPQPWTDETRLEHGRLFDAQFEHWLDSDYGECLMRSDTARRLVEESLRYHDGEHYRLYGYVVMPNHVHVVFTPLGESTVGGIVATWKSFTAHALNKALGRSGRVWQDEYFDRYIRNADHFERALRYVRRNDPRKSWWVFL